jgi:hypothetical protein
MKDFTLLSRRRGVPKIGFEKHERPDLPHKDFPHYSEGPLLVYDLRHEEVEHVKRPPTGEIGTATPLKGQVFFISVTEFLDNKEEIDGRVRTALEIYSSASHEKTERAQFVSTISSLEPLIEREKYSNLDEYSEVSEAVEETLNDLISVINDAKSKYGLSEPLQDSWRNRLKNELRGESIGQALERMVREQIPEVEGAPSVIREAYNLRSTILHEGGYIDENDHETVMEAQRLVPLIISSFIHKEAYQEAVRRRVGRDLPTI